MSHIIYCGVDFHARQQTICCLKTETGELTSHELKHDHKGSAPEVLFRVGRSSNRGPRGQRLYALVRTTVRRTGAPGLARGRDRDSAACPTAAKERPSRCGTDPGAAMPR